MDQLAVPSLCQMPLDGVLYLELAILLLIGEEEVVGEAAAWLLEIQVPVELVVALEICLTNGMMIKPKECQRNRPELVRGVIIIKDQME